MSPKVQLLQHDKRITVDICFRTHIFSVYRVDYLFLSEFYLTFYAVSY